MRTEYRLFAIVLIACHALLAQVIPADSTHAGQDTTAGPAPAEEPPATAGWMDDLVPAESVNTPPDTTRSPETHSGPGDTVEDTTTLMQDRPVDSAAVAQPVSADSAGSEPLSGDSAASSDQQGHAAGAEDTPRDTSTSPEAVESIGAPQSASPDSAGRAIAALPDLEHKSAALAPILKKKRQATIAGNALLAGSALIDYALILPEAKELDSTDIQGQLALLSPQLLSLGLRVTGPAMCCMRTSEAADAYERLYGVEAPKNRSWFFYYCGWGFYAAASGISLLGMVQENAEAWQNAALGVDILSNATWAFTGIYALIYLSKLGELPPAGATKLPPVSIAPSTAGSGAKGIACVVRF